MPILGLQQRIRELGRIRIGQVVKSGTKTRPEKLDRFRLTSASRELLEKVAGLYGGTVAEWTPANGGVQQWEVVTESARLPILVPPQPVTQWYELWSGGGCQRRCDGEREMLTDRPCLCDPDPTDRACKPTTRLNVVLRDVEGLGVWRLETHGYYAAVELPGVAELLAQAGGYITGHLGLEQRTAKREGKTRHWMVPVIEVDVTPTALLSGAAGPVGQIGPGTGSAEGEMLAEIADAPTVAVLKAMWRRFGTEGKVATPAVKEAFSARVTVLRQSEERAAAAPVSAPSVSGDADVLWQQVLTSGPEHWTTDDLERDFTARTGVEPEAATAADMSRYLELVRSTEGGGQ
jgi:hypothetical protein